MKTLVIGIFLWCTAVSQAMVDLESAIPGFRREIFHNDVLGDMIPRIFEAEYNQVHPPKLRICLTMDTREKHAMKKFELPPNQKDMYFIKKKLNCMKKVVFLIHGFLGNGTDEWLQQLSTAYLEKEDVTVFIVDWGTGAIDTRYFKSAKKASLVARKLINFIHFLMNQLCVKVSNIHMIGHGLGAHIAGFVGKKLRGINRITGLDPTNTTYPEDPPRLSKKDAKHVDIVHTSYSLGIREPIGQVNFYINNGEHQPGCYPEKEIRDYYQVLFIVNSCPHHRAIAHFIDSILNPNGIVGLKPLERARSQLMKFNPENSIAVMGLNTFENEIKGDFYIKTSHFPLHK